MTSNNSDFQIDEVDEGDFTQRENLRGDMIDNKENLVISSMPQIIEIKKGFAQGTSKLMIPVRREDSSITDEFAY